MVTTKLSNQPSGDAASSQRAAERRRHVHEVSESWAVYEFCRCGAVRRRDRPGLRRDEWHVCDRCRMPETTNALSKEA